MVDVAGAKEPVRVTYHSTASTGCRCPPPTASAWCGPRTGTASRARQIFIADWNHEHALAAIAAAPPRQAAASPARPVARRDPPHAPERSTPMTGSLLAPLTAR
jgi:hypothetical protein